MVVKEKKQKYVFLKCKAMASQICMMRGEVVGKRNPSTTTWRHRAAPGGICNRQGKGSSWTSWWDYLLWSPLMWFSKFLPCWTRQNCISHAICLVPSHTNLLWAANRNCGCLWPFHGLPLLAIFWPSSALCTFWQSSGAIRLQDGNVTVSIFQMSCETEQWGLYQSYHCYVFC